MSKTAELNKKLKRINDAFGFHIGSYAYVRQQYPEILRPSGMRRGGTGYIMPYKEALARLERAKKPFDIDISYFTRDYYEKQVTQFYEQYSDSFSIREVRKKERKRMEKIVIDSYNYIGMEYSEKDVKKYSYTKLLEAIRQANDWYSNNKRDVGNSPTFYERVIENLNGLGGNGDVETE